MTRVSDALVQKKMWPLDECMSEHSEDISEESYQALLDEVQLSLLELVLEAAHLQDNPTAIKLFQTRPNTQEQMATVRTLLEELDTMGVPLEAWLDASVVPSLNGTALRLWARDGIERLTLLDVIEGAHLECPEDEAPAQHVVDALQSMRTWRDLEHNIALLIRRANHLRLHCAKVNYPSAL